MAWRRSIELLDLIESVTNKSISSSDNCLSLLGLSAPSFAFRESRTDVDLTVLPDTEEDLPSAPRYSMPI